jgi:peptidyl-prolyl cis-trans isomerase B (cyclophilin B)
MRKFLLPTLCIFGIVTSSCRKIDNQPGQDTQDQKPASQEQKAMPVVKIETSLGTITAELFEEKTPISVANFLSYVDKSFYDETIFHRVIDGFMIQGGGFTADMNQKSPDAPIKNEASADVPNERGTLAMARTPVVDSATCQFFINLKDNSFLNHTAPNPQGFGYAVFGKVTDGMDVVDKIAKVQTGSHPTGHGDVPVEPVIIKSIKRGP